MGVVILNVFAAVWAEWALVSSPFPYWVRLIPIVVSLAIIALYVPAIRHAPEQTGDENRRRGRLIGIASAAEGIAIFVIANVLLNIGRFDQFAPAVAIIVGLHFIPLALGLPLRAYLWMALVFVAIGLWGFMLPSTVRVLTVGSAAALAMWVTTFAVNRVRT
jgi:hypothetical protein